MYEIDYSLAWKLERICPAITLYFQWIFLVCALHSDRAWFVNERKIFISP